MAEDTVYRAAKRADLEERPSVPKSLSIHGHHTNSEKFGELSPYGGDAPAITGLIRENDHNGERLHQERPVHVAEVVWTVRNEMARTVEDV